MSTQPSFAKSADACFTAYNELTGAAIVDARQKRNKDGLYEHLLAKWLQQGDTCRGTAIYEARLAQLYMLNNDFAKADAVLATSNTNGAFGRYVELAVVWSAYLKAEPNEDATALVNQAKLLTDKYPDFDEAQGLLGFILTMNEQPEPAVVALQKSLTSPVDHYDTYKALMMNYSKLGQWTQANDALQQAYALDPTLTSDPTALVFAIKISIEIGDLKTVDNLFKIMNVRFPDAKDNPVVQQLVKEYQAALQHSS